MPRPGGGRQPLRRSTSSAAAEAADPRRHLMAPCDIRDTGPVPGYGRFKGGVPVSAGVGRRGAAIGLETGIRGGSPEGVPGVNRGPVEGLVKLKYLLCHALRNISSGRGPR